MPPRIFSGADARQAIEGRESHSVADQSAGNYEITPLVDRRNRIARSERHELLSLVGEKRVVADEERTGA
jgi:hypothetical protein